MLRSAKYLSTEDHVSPSPSVAKNLEFKDSTKTKKFHVTLLKRLMTMTVLPYTILHRQKKRKLVWFLVLLSILLVYSVFAKRIDPIRPKISNPDFKIQIIQYAENLDEAGNNRIFYLETSGRPFLTRRQCCTVESAARNNPDRPIQVYIASKKLQYDTSWLKVLEHYPNVQIVQFDLEKYFTGTPLGEWFHEEEWKGTNYRVVHLSDYMRVLTLLKGGGMYMDLDYIVMKRLDENILRNFVLVESKEIKLLSNSVLHFDKGHWFIEKMIERLNKYYEPIDYMLHGPGLISSLMGRLCSLRRGEIESNNCTDIRVVPHTYFCPISNTDWEILFTNATMESIGIVNNSYGIHTWSGKTKQEQVDFNSNQLFAVLARQHCPHTVANTNYLAPEIDSYNTF